MYSWATTNFPLGAGFIISRFGLRLPGFAGVTNFLHGASGKLECWRWASPNGSTLRHPKRRSGLWLNLQSMFCENFGCNICKNTNFPLNIFSKSIFFKYFVHTCNSKIIGVSLYPPFPTKLAHCWRTPPCYEQTFYACFPTLQNLHRIHVSTSWSARNWQRPGDLCANVNCFGNFFIKTMYWISMN